MGCSEWKIYINQRKYLGIIEQIFLILLVIYIFLSSIPYWRGISKYEVFECMLLHKNIIDSYMQNIKSKEDLNKCLCFTSINPSEENYIRMTVLAVIILISGITLRTILQISYTYCIRKVRHNNRVLIMEFWTINILLGILFIGVISLLPISHMKFTNICVEPKYKGRNKDLNSGGFFAGVLLLTAYNIIWSLFICKKCCCKCCLQPQLIYFILQIIPLIFIAGIFCTLYFGFLSLLLFLDLILYTVYIGLIIGDYVYKPYVRGEGRDHGDHGDQNEQIIQIEMEGSPYIIGTQNPIPTLHSDGVPNIPQLECLSATQLPVHTGYIPQNT